MAVNSRYSGTYTKDIVNVLEVGSVGARCETSYGAEITVQWGANLPSPVPQVGERWYVNRVSASRWSFDSKITGSSYNLMRYAMELDMATCVGRERSTIDDIAEAGVNEVYLTVAGNGVVYWDSKVAEGFGLSTCKLDGEAVDYVRQVVNRCEYNNVAVTFVFDCNLWSDTGSKVHNYYQQVRLDEGYAGAYGWYALLSNVWDDVDNYTWGAVRDMALNYAEHSEHVAKWSFVTAKDAVKALVSELYDMYSNKVRGVCFNGWCIDGAYSDVSDYVHGEFVKTHTGSLLGALTDDMYSDAWWEKRAEICDFYGELQKRFISSLKSYVGNWPISVIVPSRVMCLSSERVGRFDTWLDDDFGYYGWSKVGCLLDYSKSVDRAAELRSFEYLVANMQRFGEGSTPLYGIDVFSSDDYEGAFNVLAKYNVSNVLLSDYEHWRLLSDQQVTSLKAAMNAASVTPITTLDEFGFYLSSNSRDNYFHDSFDVNRFSKAAQDFCSMLLDKLPHRMRVYYDEDLEHANNTRGLAAIVLFESMNMSQDGIDEMASLIDVEDRNVVIIGRCGMYPAHGVTRRGDIPFLDRFGEVDWGSDVFCKAVAISPGRLGAFKEVYAMDDEVLGIGLTRHTDVATANATSYSGDGSEVVAPILFNKRSSIIAMEVLDDPVLLDMASEMVLYAIGRDG